MSPIRSVSVAALALGFGACVGIVGPAGGTADGGPSGVPGPSSGNSGGGSSVGSSGVTGGGGGSTAGASGGASVSGGSGGSGAPIGPYTPGTVPLKRLTKFEYDATVRDLFASKLPAFSLPEDGREGGFDTVATALQVSDIHILAYEKIAQSLVDELFATDPKGLRRGWCSYTAATGADACAAKIVTDFAARAWRRPADKWSAFGNGLASYLGLLSASGPIGSETLEVRLKAALQGVLMSPRFIYRIELADPTGRLDTYSVASRLSYLLWSSAPDDELLAANLLDPAVLERQLRRMQVTGQGTSAAYVPQFKRFVTRFPDLWLGLDQLSDLHRDVTLFPSFDAALTADMHNETLEFFSRFLGMGDNPQYPRRPLAEMLSATAGTVTARLADHYCSVDGKIVPSCSPRLGLLTQASVMTITSAETRTSAVRRGLWVLEKLMCTTLPPPPPEAAAAAEKTAMDTRPISERQRLAEHRINPTCAACHTSIDPIGLGLENYDAIGRYRTIDAAGATIDAAGALPDGTKFEGATDLARLLAGDRRFSSCVTRQLATFATGRVLGPADHNLVAAMVASAGGQTMSLQDVLHAVVLSDAFRRRNPEAP